MNSYRNVLTCPGHTEPLFRPEHMRLVVDWTVKHFLATKAEAIAGCGQSGLLVASTVSYLTGKKLIAVRKSGEPTVACSRTISAYSDTVIPSYVIVDDMISSGGTQCRVMNEIYEHQREVDASVNPLPVVILLYNEFSNAYPDGWRPSEYRLDTMIRERNNEKLTRLFRENLELRIPVISERMSAVPDVKAAALNMLTDVTNILRR